MPGKTDEDKALEKSAAEEKDQKLADGEETETEIRPTSRLEEIEAIAERSEEERAGEFVEVSEEGAASQEEEPAGDDEPDDVKSKKESDEAEDKSKPEDKEPGTARPEMVTVKIDGEERTVPKAEVDEAGGIPAFQKNAAADKRLAEANEILKQAKETAGKKDQLPLEDAGSTRETEQTETPEDADLDEKLKAISKAIQYGDEAEVITALKDFRQLTGRGSQAATQTDDGIRKIIREEAQARDAESIKTKFFSSPEEGGFSDITEDPILFAGAKQLINDSLLALKEGELPTWEIYQEAGNEVREKYLKPQASKEDDPEGDDLAKRREKKKTIDTLRTASQSANQKPLETEKPEAEERSDAVKDIAKARGQTVL